jgi:hypothetical protein
MSSSQRLLRMNSRRPNGNSKRQQKRMLGCMVKALNDCDEHIHNVAFIGWDILHETNVHHEPVGCITYDPCIHTSYIPMLLL